MRPSRPVLAGNSHAGIDVLDLLLQEWRLDDILVIAPPAAKKHAWQPSLADHARARGVRVLDSPDVNDQEVIDALAAHEADLLLSVYFTQLFRAPFLKAVNGPAVNFHPSLLPRHRGTAPLIWAIAEGDTMAGVSVHELTLGVDTGPLLWQRLLPIHGDDTGYSLHIKATALVVATAAELLRRLIQGRGLPEPVEQTGSVTQHSSRDPQLNHIDWKEPGESIRNVVRALSSPLPGAYATWKGAQIGLERVELVSVNRPARTPGMVEYDQHLGVLVWAADCPVQIVSVRHDGNVVAADRLREIGVSEGELFA